MDHSLRPAVTVPVPGSLLRVVTNPRVDGKGPHLPGVVGPEQVNGRVFGIAPPH